MRFCDAHMHLSDYEQPKAVVELAKWNETVLFSAGVDRLTSVRTLRLAESHRSVVLPFVGVHPSEAGKASDLEWLDSSIREAVGLGEIGLDPKYSPSGRGSAQMKVFEAQLRTVQRTGKPIQVHSRGAEAECLDVLGTFENRSVLMHWFADERRLRTLGDRGYFVSFGPALAYSKKLRRMAASYDRDKVLTETDGPVSYGPLEGSQGPCLVPSVVFLLSRLWRTTFEEAREQVASNAQRYLGNTASTRQQRS